MKLTSRELVGLIKLNSLIHVVDVDDTSQDPSGSSYRAEISQLAPLFSGATVDQNNLVEVIEIDLTSPFDGPVSVSAAINSLPLFTIDEETNLVVIGSYFSRSGSGTITYLLKIGKGTYGVGGSMTPVTDSDFVVISTNTNSRIPLPSLYNPDAIVYDITGYTGTTIEEAVDTSSSTYVILTGDDVYFRLEINGILLIYRYVGTQPITLGNGGSSTVNSDYLEFYNENTVVTNQTYVTGWEKERELGNTVTIGLGKGTLLLTNGSSIITGTNGVDFDNENDFDSPFYYYEAVVRLTDGSKRYISLNGHTGSTIGDISDIYSDNNYTNSLGAIWTGETGEYEYYPYFTPTASGELGMAYGYLTTANGDYSHAEGTGSIASGQASHAEGNSTTASGDFSHVEGSANIASGQASHAEGNSNTASGDFSHVEGSANIATGYTSHAEGFNTKALGDNSHAEGNSTTASGYVSHAEGNVSQAIGYASHTEGNQTIASGQASHAEGWLTNSTNSASHSEGYLTNATGLYSHSEGQNTQATNTASHAEGNNTTASGLNSHAEGFNTIAFGSYSHAEGQNTTVNGLNAHAEGFNTSAFGSYSHAEGSQTQSIGNYSHASGQLSQANGTWSTATGYDTRATGVASYAEGAYSIANGSFSHAEGNSSVAWGSGSHAEGSNTIAGGSDSHAEGSQTAASGATSHAGGSGTLALGDYSFAHGAPSGSGPSTLLGPKANGAFSLAFGTGTEANGTYSMVQGINNKAYSYGEVSLGTFGTVYTPNNLTGWDSADRAFNFGNGFSSGNRADVLQGIKSGVVTAPSLTNALITGATSGKVLVTRDYMDYVKPYKVYTALLTQTGTSAPTAIVLENSLGGIGYNYSDAGEFEITSTGLFTTDKTALIITNGSNTITYFELSTTSSVYLFVRTANTLIGANDALNKTVIEIRVYN